MEDLRYLPAVAGDLGALQDFLGECGLPAKDLTPEHLPHFILVRSGSRIVGSVGLELLGDVALLRSLAVARELRGYRLGHELWTRSRDLARACGVMRLYLLTTTADELFARWGFRRIPRDQAAEVVQQTTEFSTMCPASATVMALDLEAARPVE